MSTSPNQFKKKKIVYDFSDNAMMTASVKNLVHPSEDKKFLAMQKQLRKVNKNYDELFEQYDRMKSVSISTTVDLDLDLQEANQTIFDLEEEREMLLARISHLEKENSELTRSYQRPLNRSVVKSAMKRSTINSQNININRSRMEPSKTERSENSLTSIDDMIKKDLSLNDFDADRLSFTEDNLINTIKFDKKQQDKNAIIGQEILNDQHISFCGNKRCIHNFNQLQDLRKSVSDLADRIEDVFMKIQFQVEKRLNQKNIALHKQKLEALCKQNPGANFFYKVKPEYLIEKIEEKIKDFTKSKNYQAYNPLLTKINEKMRKIKSEEEELRQEFACESYDFDQDQKKLIQMLNKQDRIFKTVHETMKKNGINDPHIESLRNKQVSFKKSEFKKAGIFESD